MSPTLKMNIFTSSPTDKDSPLSLPLQRRDTPPRYPVRTTDECFSAQSPSNNCETARHMPHRGVTKSTRLNKLAIPGQKQSNPLQDIEVFNRLPLTSTQFNLILRCSTAHSA